MTPFAVSGPYLVQIDFYHDGYEWTDGFGLATIGPNVEYPAAFYGYFSVNLKLRKMIITFLVSLGWGSGEFLGPVVTSLTSGAYLPQPAYFISYTNNPGTLTSTPTTISLNWRDLNFNQGDTIVIGW